MFLQGIRQKELAEEAAEFKRQSQAVQRGLPLPERVNRDILRGAAPTNAEQMVCLAFSYTDVSLHSYYICVCA